MSEPLRDALEEMLTMLAPNGELSAAVLAADIMAQNRGGSPYTGTTLQDLRDIATAALAAPAAEPVALDCPPCMECGGPTKLYGVFDLTEWNCTDDGCGTFTIKSVPAARAESGERYGPLHRPGGGESITGGPAE